MDFRFQGLNILYIMPAVLAIIYINAIGQAAKKKLSYLKAPSLLVGFITNLALMAPLLVFVNLNKTTNYQVIFIIYTIILFIGSIIYVKDANKLFKPSKPAAYAIITTYIISLAYGGIIGRGTGLGNDYWLYGRWFSEGSRFVSTQPIGTEHSINYAFTTMYRWMGSFSGMLTGPINVPNIRNDQLQSFTTIIWISMSIQFVKWYVKDISTSALLIGGAGAAYIGRMYGTGFYGSFSIFFITLIAIKPAFGGKNNGKQLLYLSIGYMSMASTIIVISPMILLSYLMLNKEYPRLPKTILKYSSILVFVMMLGVLKLNNGFGPAAITPQNVLRVATACVIVQLSSFKVKDLLLKLSICTLLINILLNSTYNLFPIDGLPAVVVHRFANFIFVGDYWSHVIMIVSLPMAINLIQKELKKYKIK